MSKQTAVEWLVNHITEDQIIKAKSMYEWLEIFEQAKQMEKEQMKEAHLIADHYPRGYEFDKWYNETYGGNNG
jgi:hypothetical protein